MTAKNVPCFLQKKNKALQEKQNYEIYAATLRERNRIAREIHDNVGHLLSRTILLTGAAKTLNRDKNMEVCGRTGHITEFCYEQYTFKRT